MKKRILISYLLLSTAITIYAQQTNFPKLTGPYLGQKCPGITPEVFAPGIVNTHHRVYANVTFNPDITEVAWTLNTADTSINHGGIIVSKIENGYWSVPKEIHFLDGAYNHRCPYYSLDGERLYFQGYNKNNQGWDQFEKFYYVEKTSNGWTFPIQLDTIFNKYAVHWQFSLDKENNIYFGGDLRGKVNSGGIYFSKYQYGKYIEPVLIFDNKTWDEAVFGPAISPDGDYIIFARIHPRGSANPRIFSIYISFKNKENGWSEPKELGELLKMDGNQPRVSPDGKYIFFIDNSSVSYWISSKIIEELRPKE